jgi:translation initiation factor IF-2
MTDIDETEARKTDQVARPRKLELKKTVETGQVRQSFAHGRSKMVTVEVRKKRTFAPDSRGHMSEVRGDAARDAELRGLARAASDAVAREGLAVALTNEEKAKRARVVQDAARRAEEDRHLAETMPAAEIGQADDLQAEEPAAAEAPAPAEFEQPEPVAAAAEPAEPTVAEAVTVVEAAAPAPEPAPSEPAQPEPAPSAAGAAAAAAAPPGKQKEGVVEEEETEARAGAAKRAPAKARRGETVARRDDAGRRSGKLTLVDALADGSERMRSLASVRRARQKEKLKQLQQMRGEAQKIVRDVVIPESITVQELANRMAERGADVIKSLMRMGVMATITQSIDGDTAEVIATEFGHNVKRVSESDVEIGLRGLGDEDVALQARPPVVTVMGHVDHGKTSLLDALRKSDVAQHEAGGITQHIGAYQVTLPGGAKITFIDTPGHEAFTHMRARGARVTDIVVLVVAADDGVMPQTVEAISHAKAAEVPTIVAINKIDRPDADVKRVKTALMQHGVFVEDMGGDTLSVEVSAKTGANLDRLAEAILLQAELLDLKSNPQRPAEGVVIETKVERGRGAVATLLVQRGTLRVGDIFVAGSEWGRVRGMTDANGVAQTEAGPGTPVEVLGLNGMPAAGDEVIAVDSEARAREVSEFRQRRQREARTATVSRGTLEQMLTRIQDGGEGKVLPVVIKADVHGSAEAIVGALQKLGTDQISVNILYSGVGGINEGDVTLARASNALVVGFNVRANPQAREAARRDGVEIRYYSIIYDLTDDVRGLLSGMLAPTLRENIIGYAQIREVFTISKVGKIAGCMVTEGQVRRGAKVRLLRDNIVIHQGELSQLRRFKDDVREVKEGYDCGIALAGYQDIRVGDMIEAYELEEVARTL